MSRIREWSLGVGNFDGNNLMLRLDLTPASQLHRRLSRAAIFTTFTIYLEAVAAGVAVTESRLSLAVLFPIGLVLAFQVVCVWRPVRKLVRGHLTRAYLTFYALAAVFIALLWLGSGGGEDRVVAVALGAIVVLLPSWPTVACIREVRAISRLMRSVADPEVLLTCLSFDPFKAAAARIRSFGGGRLAWVTAGLSAISAFAVVFIALALILQGLGLKPASPIGMISAAVASWTFYSVVRYTKPSASALRTHDARTPVLILREFRDDKAAFRGDRLRKLTGAASFELLLGKELDRFGPTISVGRPGELVPPLGASRDYLTGSDWRTAVATLINEAGLVVFVLGHTENLIWEFRATISLVGMRNILIIIPPLSDHEVSHRWAQFLQNISDIDGIGLPRDLPAEHPVVAFFFAGDDAVMMLGRRRDPYDYRLAVRLFRCLVRKHQQSGAHIENAIRKLMPIASATETNERAGGREGVR